MPELVGLHLGQAQHSVLTLAAVVVSLLPAVGTVVNRTLLNGRVLVKARVADGVHLLVLAPVGDHLVGVRAVLVALQAVEMT